MLRPVFQFVDVDVEATSDGEAAAAAARKAAELPEGAWDTDGEVNSANAVREVIRVVDHSRAVREAAEDAGGGRGLLDLVLDVLDEALYARRYLLLRADLDEVEGDLVLPPWLVDFGDDLELADLEAVVDRGQVGGALEHEHGEGDGVQVGEGPGQPLVVLDQATEPGGPGEGPLNGLIANDKLCLTRTGRLQLGWPRARGRLRGSAPLQLGGEVTHRGGEHEAAAHLAGPAHGRAGGDRPAALGPGLPAPPAVGGDGLARAGADAGVPDPAGDVPCA